MPLPMLPPPHCKTANRPYRRTSAAAFEGALPEADDPLLGFAPYVHAAPRRNSITPERQRAFIAELAASGIVTQAARVIGASLEALYKLRNRKGAEGFAAAWEQALDRGMARLQDCALERAIQGEERPIVGRSGEVVARWTRYDTGLITFLLRQGRGKGSGDISLKDLRPGNRIYERLKREWEEERARQQEEKMAAMSEENERFLLKLNRRLGQIRAQAVDAGLLVLDENGKGKFVGLDDDEEGHGNDHDAGREDGAESPASTATPARGPMLRLLLE
jgi:hypothetical protein